MAENGQDSGRSMRGSFAQYDHPSSSWKTSQACLSGTLEEFSETWPRAGLMRSGTVSRRVPLVPRTFGGGYLWLPTPRETQERVPYFRVRNGCSHTFSSANLEEVLARMFPEVIGKRLNRDLLRWMMGFPIGHMR